MYYLTYISINLLCLAVPSIKATTQAESVIYPTLTVLLCQDQDLISLGR